MPQASPVVLDAGPVLAPSPVVDVVLVVPFTCKTASFQASSRTSTTEARAASAATATLTLKVVSSVVVVDATLVLDAEAEVVGVDPLLLCPTGAAPQNPSLQLSSVPQSLSPLQG